MAANSAKFATQFAPYVSFPYIRLFSVLNNHGRRPHLQTIAYLLQLRLLRHPLPYPPGHGSRSTRHRTALKHLTSRVVSQYLMHLSRVVVREALRKRKRTSGRQDMGGEWTSWPPLRIFWDLYQASSCSL